MIPDYLALRFLRYLPVD